MDRNQNYQNYLIERMEENRQERKMSSKCPCIKKSRSKDDLHILAVSEIIYDNRQNIKEQDYIQIMNHLKEISKILNRKQKN